MWCAHFCRDFDQHFFDEQVIDWEDRDELFQSLQEVSEISSRWFWWSDDSSADHFRCLEKVTAVFASWHRSTHPSSHVLFLRWGGSRWVICVRTWAVKFFKLCLESLEQICQVCADKVGKFRIRRLEREKLSLRSLFRESKKCHGRRQICVTKCSCIMNSSHTLPCHFSYDLLFSCHVPQTRKLLGFFFCYVPRSRTLSRYFLVMHLPPQGDILDWHLMMITTTFVMNESSALKLEICQISFLSVDTHCLATMFATYHKCASGRNSTFLVTLSL